MWSMKITNSNTVVDLNILDITGRRQQQTNAERVGTNTNISTHGVDYELQCRLLCNDVQSLNYVQKAGSYNANAQLCIVYVQVNLQPTLLTVFCN